MQSRDYWLSLKTPITLGEPALFRGFYTKAIFHKQKSKFGPYLHLLKCLFAGAAAGMARESNATRFPSSRSPSMLLLQQGYCLDLNGLKAAASHPCFKSFAAEHRKISFFFFSLSTVERKRPVFV